MKKLLFAFILFLSFNFLDVQASVVDYYDHFYNASYYFKCSESYNKYWPECQGGLTTRGISFEYAVDMSFDHDFVYFIAWYDKDNPDLIYGDVYQKTQIPVIRYDGSNYYFAGFGGTSGIYYQSPTIMSIYPDQKVMTAYDGQIIQRTAGLMIGSSLDDIEIIFSNVDIHMYDDVNNTFGDLIFSKNWNLSEENYQDLPWDYPGETAPEPEPTPTPTPEPTPTVEEEQLEVSHGIFDTLGSIFETIITLPSTIVNLLIDAVKTLFIPSDGFLSTWFNDVKDAMEDQLGFLAYPVTWVLDFLDKFLALEDTGSYVISWPDIKVPNFDQNIINAGSYDLADLLDNSTINTFHELYLMVINALMLLGFMKLCNNTFNRVFGGEIDNYEYVTVDRGYNVDESSGEVTSSYYRKRVTTKERSDK